MGIERSIDSLSIVRSGHGFPVFADRVVLESRSRGIAVKGSVNTDPMRRIMPLLILFSFVLSFIILLTITIIVLSKRIREEEKKIQIEYNEFSQKNT